jgi:hypothetical protein
MGGRSRCSIRWRWQTIANTSLDAVQSDRRRSSARQYTNGMFGRKQLGIDEWYQDRTGRRIPGTFTPRTPRERREPDRVNAHHDRLGLGATTLKKGDIFTIAGVNSVNPLSYQSTAACSSSSSRRTSSDTTGAITTLPIRRRSSPRGSCRR